MGAPASRVSGRDDDTWWAPDNSFCRALVATATYPTFEWSTRETCLTVQSFTVQPPEAAMPLDREGARMPRLLIIVARDRPELLELLRQRFATVESEDVIEIFMDRRQGPRGPGVQPREADGHRRDPRRNRGVGQDLRELGCAVLRLPGSFPQG